MLGAVHRRALTLLVAAVAAVASVAPIAAAPGERARRRAEVTAEINSLREQVSEASEEEAELLDELDGVQGRRRQLDGKVAALDRQLAVVQGEVDQAETRLEEMQRDFVRTQTNLALTQDRLLVHRRALRDRAVAAYVGNPSSATVELMLRAKDLRQVAAAAGYLESIVEVQRGTVARVTALRDAHEELRHSLESKKDAAKAQRDLVVARKSALEGVRGEHESARREVVAEEVHQGQLLGEVRARQAEFEAEIAALRAESGSVSALLRGLQAGQAPTVGGPGLLGHPVPGAVVTSGFGPRVHPILGTARMHDGVDYRAVTGTPIRAARAGSVVSAGPQGGYGNATIVDHGGSLATLYAHQSAMYVSPGTAVAAGQVIGAVGSTGFSTGPHLHFEARVAGIPVNPLPYL